MEVSRTFNLLGHDYGGVWNAHHPEALPSDLRGINFAVKKLSQTTAEWGGSEGVNDGREVLGITKSEFVCHTVKALLRDYCTSDIGVEQAATLLEDVHDMDIAHVTGVVAAASPSKWPAKAIAQKLVTILEKTLGPYQEGDSPESRPFKSAHDAGVQINSIVALGDTVVGTKIQECLRRYFIGATSVSTSDFESASRLLTFCEPDDTETMSTIVEALGSSLMPSAAISQSISKLIKQHRPKYFEAVHEELLRRYELRSVTPSVFPTSRGPGGRSSTRPHSPRRRPISRSRSRTPSRSPSRPPSPHHRRLKGKGASRRPSSVSPERRLSSTGRSISGHHAPSHRRRVGQTSGRSRREGSPQFDSGPVEDVMMEVDEFIPGSASAPSSPKRLQSPLPPASGSVVLRYKDRTASSRTGTIAQPSTSSILQSDNVAFEHNVTKTLGRAPVKFKWWNLVLTQFTGIKDIGLAEKPGLGDVLTYWSKDRGEAGAFAYLSNGWVNITDDYFGNTGKVQHPSFSVATEIRVLTWKNAEEKEPSWVKEKYYRTHKAHYASNMVMTLSAYKRGFHIKSSTPGSPGRAGSPIEVED